MDKITNFDMTYTEILQLKEDFAKFIDYIQIYCQQKKFEVTQNDRDFFIFISKRIIFFKTINLTDTPLYTIKVLISDMYNLILTIINNEKRYIYLNERSIIENYTRLVLNSNLENDHITVNLFDKIKNNYSTIFTNDIFSLIKNEYRIACSYIHGGNSLESSLISYFNECIAANECLTERYKYYDRFKKIIQCYDKIFIYTHGFLIDVAFHRRKSVLGYLLGSKYVDLLFQLKSEKGF